MKTMMAKTVRPLLSLLLSLTLTGLCFAAGGDLDWSYNSATLAKQDVRDVAFDSSGSVVLVGVDDEGAASDWFVAKLTADGQSLSWPTKGFDLNAGIDVATAVVVDGNDDIIVTGYGHNGSNYDIQTIKYAGSDGSVIWQHTYNGLAGGDDIATAIGIDSSYNVYVGGYLQGSSGNDDFIIIKYQASGPVNDTPLWDTPINGSADGNDRLMALAVNGSSLAVTGESESSTLGDFDFLTHKLNLDGTLAWLGGPQVYSDSGNGKGLDVAIDSTGSVIATGYVDDGARAMYTARYASADGTAIWVKQQNGETIEGGHALAISGSDDVFVTGTSYTLTTAYDVYTVKYQSADPVGGVPVTLWEDSYNTTNGNHDVGHALAIDSGDDLYVTAYSNDASGGYDDILTLKYGGGDGARLWPQTLYDLEGLHNRPVAIGLAPSGNILIGGWSDTAAYSYDFIALSYDPGAIDPPTDLTAAVTSNTEIQLSWTDNSAEDNFVVERRAEDEGGFTEIATLGSGSTSYDSTGLANDTRYYYRVKATSAADGSSAWSNIANARTTVISYTAPTWLYPYAGPDSGDDDPYGIATGADQHPVVTGTSFSIVGGYDYLTIKLDRSDAASEQWQARYNDGDNEGDTAISVVVDSQNRVIVTGYSSLYGGGASNTNDIYTLGYPATGPPEIWSDQYNGPFGNDDKSSAVAVASDGSDNTVVVGYGKNAAFDNDIYVIKFDPDGNRLWAATPFDGGDEDYPTAVAFDSSGNVYVAGRSYNGTDDDWFVARYATADGTLTHTAPLHAFSGNGNDYAEAITVDATGDVYITGYADNGVSGDIYTVKYAGSDLSLLWQQADDSGGYDHGAAIGIDPVNDDILVAGTSFIGAGNHDFRLIRYTASGSAGNGDVVWNHRLDLSGSDDSVTAMAIDRSGVAILTGTSDYDILSVKIDHNEAIVGANVFDGSANDIDYPAAVATNRYGEAFVAGSTMNADAVPNTDYVIFMVDGSIMPAPTPLTATQLYAEVSLSWVDNDLDGTGFRLERKLNGCASPEPWQPPVDFAAAVTSFVDTPVNDNTTYCYRVQSYSVTDSSRWVELEVTTADPVAPSDLNAAMMNDSDIQLTWTDNTTDASNYDFHIERCSGASCDFSVKDDFMVSAATATNSETGIANWVDTTACSGLAYRYRVKADKPGLWASLFSSPTAAAGITPVSPGAPTSLTADRVSETLVDLSWLDSSDGEDEFVIERCDGDAASCASGVWNTIGTLASLAGNQLLLRMDEATWDGTPAEVTDLSGQGHHGTANGATTTTAGRFDRGGELTEPLDRIDTSLVLDQSLTSAGATFSAWVRPGVASGEFFLFDSDNGGNDWSLLHNGTSWLIATGDDAGLVDTGIAVEPDSWQHVAASFDPATGVALFKNGLPVWSDPAIDFDASTDPLSIGMLRPQPAAHLLMHMDELSWTNGTPDVVDSSGQGNDGTSYNGAVTVADGKFGRAGEFDGSSSYIATPLTIDQSSGSSGTTFEAWVYPTLNDGNYRHVISTENGGYDWSIVQRSGYWYIYTGSTRYYTAIPATPGQWQHIIAVFDPASGVQFYKNGGENSYTTTNIGFDSNTHNLTIGRYANSTTSNYHFPGRIDEVIIHDRPLTAAEAQRRYQQSAFIGIIDEVAVFDRPLSASAVSTLHQHGIARYSDTTITANSDYSYRVKADKPGSCGSDWPTATSTPLQVTTTPPAPELMVTVEDIGRARLDWTPLTTTQTGFKVERCTVSLHGAGCSPSVLLDDSLAAGDTRYVDETTCAGETYRYQVTALQNPGWGSSPPSSVVEAAIPTLATPSGLTASDLSEGHLTLHWDYPAVDASGFKVGYCATSGTCSADGDFTISTALGLPSAVDLLLHMDETAWVNGSADVIDASGNGHHGTSLNGAATTAEGRDGWAGDFDGSNDHITTLLNIDQSSSSAGATFEAWVYPTLNDGNYRHVISTENGGYDWSIVQRSGYWYIYTGATRYSTGIQVAFNKWQQITAVFDPATGVQFYTNGGESSYSNANIGFESGTANLTIGRYASSTSSSYHYRGRIDEVVVYDRPLTAQEVQDRFARKQSARLGVLTPSTEYVFRVWPFRNDPCNSEGPATDSAVASTTSTVIAPSGLTATDSGTTRVDLSWTVETTSGSLLQVERCTGTSASCGTADANFIDFSASPVTLPAAASTYSDATICAESAYTYRVRAERDSAPTWVSGWTYVERPALVLPAPANFQASGISESEILVDWDDATLDETVFLLERCQDADFSCGTPTIIKTEPAGSLVYHFDEAAWVNGAADVLDDTDAGRTGTSYNGANTLDEGRFGRGGDFSSNTDYLLTPLNIDQSAAGSGATFQAWVYPTVKATNYWHVISTENGGYDWSLVHYNGFWYVYTGTTRLSTAIAVDLNQWQHIAAVFDPATGVTFYKNGGLLPADIYTTSNIGFDGSDYNLTIGRYANSTSSAYNFIGRIDEVVVNERPLSAAEILDNYLQPFHSYTDVGLTPGTDYSYRLTVSKVVTDSNPDGCDWSVNAIYNTATLAPPAPEQFVVANQTTTSAELTWQDKSGSETVYQFQRCADTLVNCAGSDALYNSATFPSVDLPADSESYNDDCAETDTPYSYRVRARKAPYVPPGWDTAWVYLETRTDAVSELSNFSVDLISEVRIDLGWDDSNSDETGFIIERCTGSGCDFSVKETVTISDPAAHVTYQDDELEPNQTYNYRVRAYKTVACADVDDWSTGYAGPLEAGATVAAPNLLSATEMSTSRIDLVWTDNAPSATGTVIERCNEHPCADAFAPVATANIGATGFSDISVCQNSTYSYRIKSVGEQLSNNGGSCWNRRARVNITSFTPEMALELEVPIDDDMRTDFSDLRFFDETAKRELPFWIEQVVDPGLPTARATVLIRAWHNDDIYLYYGNASATDSSNKDAFVQFEDNFAGTVIDTGRWVDLDPGNYMVQDDGLHLYDLVNGSSWSGLISTATFDRTAGLELLVDVSLPANSDGVNYFAFGWEKDQTASTNSTHWAHTVYWYNNTEFRVYENGTAKDPGTYRFYPNNQYTLRVAVDPVAGARYYVRGGAYADWTLFTQTTADGNRYNGSPLRLNIMQHSQDATISFIQVRTIVDLSATTLGGEEPSGSCYNPGYSWASAYSSEDVWETTSAAQAPTLDTATALDDTRVDLTWTNNIDPDASFRIERCCGGGCSYTFLANTTSGASSYSDMAAPPSSNCSYQVYATKNTGDCSWDVGPSNSLSADTYAAAAAGLTATAENSRLIRLNWTDLASDEDGYDIQVMHGNGSYVSTATVGANYDIHFDGRNIEPERTYNYRIRSFRRIGSNPPYTYEWSAYTYSNPVTTPVFTVGDDTCLP